MIAHVDRDASAVTPGRGDAVIVPSGQRLTESDIVDLMAELLAVECCHLKGRTRYNKQKQLAQQAASRYLG